MARDHIEQVGSTTENTSENKVNHSSDSSSIRSTEHPTISTEEVSLELEQTNHDVSAESDSNSDITNVINSGEHERYQLPPRSTRGVPPKRYDPEFEAQRSKYPIQSICEGNLSQTTIAFTTSLYSNTIPKNVEKALLDENGKRLWKRSIWP